MGSTQTGYQTSGGTGSGMTGHGTGAGSGMTGTGELVWVKFASLTILRFMRSTLSAAACMVCMLFTLTCLQKVQPC